MVFASISVEASQTKPWNEKAWKECVKTFKFDYENLPMFVRLDQDDQYYRYSLINGSCGPEFPRDLALGQCFMSIRSQIHRVSLQKTPVFEWQFVCMEQGLSQFSGAQETVICSSNPEFVNSDPRCVGFAVSKTTIRPAMSTHAKPQKKSGVTLGMTPEQALQSSWGRPERINRTINSSGIFEQWVYGNGNYLYFTNGKLTTIQN